jgi:hypothetical protein
MSLEEIRQTKARAHYCETGIIAPVGELAPA